MDMLYSFESRVRYSEVGEDRKLTIQSLLDYFQDASIFHSEDVGVGIDYYMKKDEAWVLSAWQICVNRYPHLCEEIVIGTTPYAFKGFIGYRNFEMKTREGEVLAYANSVWSLMNMKQMVPARIEPEAIKCYGQGEKYPMEYAPRKISLPDGGEKSEPFAVQTFHLDCNHHVNNGQYVRMAMNYAPEGREIRQIRVEYRSQARLGDWICPEISQDKKEALCTIALNSTEKKPYCIVELLFKEKSADRSKNGND